MKIGALIPIRLASERLPKKALMDISGKPVVHHLLERAFACKYIKDKKDVVVCTTEEASDDELVPVVEEKGASVFRGSTDDIVKRMCDAVEHFGFDAVIEIDGDDVTADPLYMDYCLKHIMEDDSVEVVLPKDLPLGLATKALRRSAFETVRKIYKTEKNDTGFMYYFTKTGYCKVLEVSPYKEEHKYESRLTLDYQEDLDLFRAIFDELYEDGKVFNIEDIGALLKRKPELNDINSSLNEEYWARTKEKMKIEYEGKEGDTKKIEF